MKRLSPWVTASLLATLVLWAAFLRGWNLGNRPFWCDEAWVAEALRGHTYGELLHQTDAPLPPLFAIVTKALGAIVSPPEWGSRLPPALAGVLLIPLAYATARTLRAPRCIALGVACLCASSVVLVIWSRELKQYSLEGFCSTAMALLVFQHRRAAIPGRRRLLATGIVGLSLVAPWLGYGAAIPIGVLLGLLFVRPRGSARGPGMLAGSAGVIGLLLSVAVLWHVAASAQSGNPALVASISNWYLHPLDFRSWVRTAGHGAVSTAIALFPLHWFGPNPSPLTLATLAATAIGMWLIALLGVAAWPRRGRLELAWWLFGTWLGTLALAVAQRYPFGLPRLMLFAAIPLLFALAHGIVVAVRWVSLTITGHGAPVLACATALAAIPAAYVIAEPLSHGLFAYHDIPTVLRELKERRRPEEVVYIELYAAPSTRYYAPDLPEPAVVTPTTGGTLLPHGMDPLAPARQALARTTDTLWIVDVNVPGNPSSREILQFIQQSGFQVDLILSAGPKDSCGGNAELLKATRVTARQRPRP